MVDFNLFCELSEYLSNLNVSESKDGSLNYKFNQSCELDDELKNIIEKSRVCYFKRQDESDAFLSLIYNCNREQLKSLMEYFEADAPIQRELKKRYNELEVQNSTNDINKINNNESSFFERLCSYIDEKGYASDADFYNYAAISRQTFSKIRNNATKISRETAIHLAVALELDYESAEQFLNEAGYSLKSTNRRDAIVAFVMRKKQYTFQEINELLFMFNEKTFLDN